MSNKQSTFFFQICRLLSGYLWELFLIKPVTNLDHCSLSFISIITINFPLLSHFPKVFSYSMAKLCTEIDGRMKCLSTSRFRVLPGQHNYLI